MGTKQLLLLLALGAVHLSHAAHQVAWEVSSQTGYKGYLTTVSGTVMSDQGCAPPPPPPPPVKALRNTFCQPLGQVEVTVTMDGVGELYADPSELARSSPAAAKTKDKPVNKNNKRSDVKAHPVTVVTDADGNFKAYVISYEDGTSTLKASAVVANITQESGDLTVDWYAPVYTFTVEPQYPADSIGNSQVITARLLLGQLPERTAPADKSITTVRPKAAGDDLVPLKDVLITFYRQDYNATEEKKKVAKASKDGKRTHIREDYNWVEFGTGYTDELGVATATLPSPEFEGLTEIQARFWSPAETEETTNTGTIAWYPPVPLPKLDATTTSTIVGRQSIITITLTDTAEQPLQDKPVTIKVQGSATEVPPPARRHAPAAARDADITLDKITDAAGTVSVTLVSATPGDSIITASYDLPDLRVITSQPLTITWADLPAPTLVASKANLTVGQDSVVTATLVDDQGAARADVNVNFFVTGSAQDPNAPVRRSSAPSIRDFTQTVATAADGTASITLRSDSAGTSTVRAAYITEDSREVTSEPLDITWSDTAGPNFSNIKLWSKPREAPVDRPIRVSAGLLDDVEEPVAVAGINVSFAVARVHSDHDDRAEMSAADAADDKFARFAVTNEEGVATVNLESERPGEFAVVASAENDQGTVVASKPLLVRWYAEKHGYPHHDYPKHDDYPKHKDDYHKHDSPQHDDYPKHKDYYPKHGSHKHDKDYYPKLDSPKHDDYTKHDSYPKPDGHPKHDEYYPKYDSPKGGYANKKPYKGYKKYGNRKTSVDY